MYFSISIVFTIRPLHISILNWVASGIDCLGALMELLKDNIGNFPKNLGDSNLNFLADYLLTTLAIWCMSLWLNWVFVITKSFAVLISFIRSTLSFCVSSRYLPITLSSPSLQFFLKVIQIFTSLLLNGIPLIFFIPSLLLLRGCHCLLLSLIQWMKWAWWVKNAETILNV